MDFRVMLNVSTLLLTQVIIGTALADTATSQNTPGDDIIVTGTRRAERTASASNVPVDVVSRAELTSVPSADLNDKLAQIIPSFNVQRMPGFDGAMFVRPATLRGLSSDQTLVLLNSKRRHHTAYINVQQQGEQPVDLSQIPEIAIGRVEVLRDGASAQYGSDAIAGVINVLLDESTGINMTAQASQYYRGDGDNYQLAGRAGIALRDRGVLSTSFEVVDSRHTNRAPPTSASKNGQPDLRSYKGFIDFKYAVTDNFEAYGFGNYNHSRIRSEFSHQNPATSPQYARSIYQDGPPFLYPAYNVTDIFPNGYTPYFGSTIKDASGVLGFRGELIEGLTADISGRYGRDSIRYDVQNTINPSLGPLTPTNFYAGTWIQSEQSANADFNYLWNAGLSSPINISFGAEARREKFTLRAGEYASYAVGPLSDLTSGSHTYPGPTPSQAGSWDRGSVASYVDVDADLTKRLNVSFAGRFEHFEDFGSSWTYKAAARYSLTDWLNLRGSVSTGFHAPTPGQQNLTNTRQSPDPLDLTQTVVNGLIPSTNPVAVAVGGKPLVPEKSTNLSAGFVIKPVNRLTISVDYYNIKITDRLGISLDQTLTGVQRAQLIAGGVSQAATLTQFRFFINGFYTRTQGVDVVANYSLPVGPGELNLTAAYAYNKSKILPGGDPRVATPVFYQEIEKRRPHNVANVAANYTLGAFGFFAKVRYYDKFMDAVAFLGGGDFNAQYNEQYGLMGARAFVDLAASYKFANKYKLTVGAENILNTYPDRLRGFLAAGGSPYPFLRPYEADGGRYYARFAVNL